MPCQYTGLMPVENARRRTLLRGMGTAAIVSLAGCMGGGTSSDSNSTDSDSHSKNSDSNSEKSLLQIQLERAKEATSKYEDSQKALEEGFKLGGPYVPGMGWHFMHPKRLQDAAKNGLSIEKPPMLTYVEADGELQLASIEYGLPAQAADETPDLFADETSDKATEEWHSHGAATHVFAKPDGKQNKPATITFDEWTTNDYWTEFQPPDKNLQAGDEVALNWGTAHGKEGEKETRIVDVVSHHPNLTTLHAWVHIENPGGVFKPINPDYAEGSGH